MSKAQDKFWPMVLSLSLIALISGGLLAVVYNVTKEPIEVAKEMAKQEKLKAVLPEFDSLTDSIVDGTPVTFAYSDGKTVGYAISTEANGYGGAVKVLTGYNADGTIIDYAILEHQETPGLGAKAGEWFKKSIPGGNAATSYSVKKDGGNVDAITAATITSRAFLNAVNSASNVYNSINNRKPVDAVSGASKVKKGAENE